MGVVVNVGPGAEGCDMARISLRCDMCEFKTVMMKKRKARRSLTIHTRSMHQQDNKANNVIAHVQELAEIAPPSTRVSLQCEVLNCDFRTPLLLKRKAGRVGTTTNTLTMTTVSKIQ